MIVLGIETSCDETGCGIVDDRLAIRSNPLYSQVAEHTLWGGVVPEIASRAHLAKVVPVTTAALSEAGVEAGALDLVAFTRGPGLLGPLLVGASFARGLARNLGIPAYGINHLEGHIAAARISEPSCEPPFVALTVSGGHTELMRVDPGFRYTLLGRTRDDAAGEAFDKCGKMLGLGYPAGATIGRLAREGDPKRIHFPRGLHADGSADFSFSGLKTAVARWIATQPPDDIGKNLSDICASLQEAIVDPLVNKAAWALKQTGLQRLLLCGGVSANQRLRAKLAGRCGSMGVQLVCPAPSMSTDNGAMIAAAAIYRIQEGLPPCGNEVKPWLPLA